MPVPVRPVRHRVLALLAAAALTAGVVLAGLASRSTTAEALAPAPWVVSLGDSYISGEGGRWAGNQSFLDSGIDTGSDAYFDNAGGTAETIPYCHRSKSAMIHLGPEVNSLNLACSGATTASAFDGDKWKPGIDTYDDGRGHLGQAKMLADFAKDHPVKMVALSIGGNDFNFSKIVEACVKSYLTPGWFTDPCSKQSSTRAYVSDARAKAVRADIVRAIGHIRDAMRSAGTADGDWTLVVNTYQKILPYPGQMRYSDGTWERQTIGGCGFRDPDLTWALNEALGTINSAVRGAVADAQAASGSNRYVIMENSEAFSYRALCDRSVYRVAEGPRGPWADSWKDAGAVDKSEWVTEINITNLFAHYKQESLHPNYWGQLALRNCLRQVWNGGDVRGGTCVRGAGGLNDRGEPNMGLRGAVRSPAPVAAADQFTLKAGVRSAPGSVLVGDVDHPTYVAPLPATATFRRFGGTGAASTGNVGAIGFARTGYVSQAGTAGEGDLVIPAVEGGLSAELVSGTTNGVLDLNADGTFAYWPNAGFTGTDTFTYVASDLYGTSEPATVVLRVVADVPAAAPATPTRATPAFTG